MTDKKTVFIAFAIEDEGQRNLFTGQSLHPKCPYEFIDLSVKDAYVSDWKDKVRTRIRRCHGVIALTSKNSLSSSGQKWELDCAKDEKKRILAVWAYTNDRSVLPGVPTVEWTWPKIDSFIESL